LLPPAVRLRVKSVLKVSIRLVAMEHVLLVIETVGQVRTVLQLVLSASVVLLAILKLVILLVGKHCMSANNFVKWD